MKNLNYPEIIKTVMRNLASRTGFLLDRQMVSIGRNRLLKNINTIRNSSLELVAYEILERNLQGSLAELGVFRGDFAARINEVFPDRTLYLFDTFEGFDKRDISRDVKSNYSTGTQDFSKTSIELVLSKMKYPENCIVKKGFFPETAQDVDDNFVFLSIDADLYAPIYEGLKFFYPKLVGGGYIFVHDYNNAMYKGAKEAVRQYCGENNIPYFPLCDSCGSAIIWK